MCPYLHLSRAAQLNAGVRRMRIGLKMWFATISCAVMAAALFGCRSADHPALDTLA